MLAIDARHADCLHLLGLIAFQTRRHAAAIDLISQAIALRDDVTFFYNNLGNVLQDLGRLAEAAAQYERALALRPDYAQAHNNLGLALQRQGMFADAVAHYQRALALDPDYPQVHANLGTTLLAQGKLHEAIVHYERALVLGPNYAEAHNNLGLALHRQGKFADAVAQYRRALALNPDYAAVHSNLGNALLAENKPQEAIAHYERAIALEPDYAEAHNNLGLVLEQQGKLDAAIAHYERALGRNPDYPQAHNNLGNALQAQGRFSEAVAHYERALVLKPDYAQAYNNLGIVLQNLGNLAHAQRAYEKAIDLAPETVRYYRPLLDVRRVAADDRYLAAMEKLAQDMASFSSHDQQELHFALGKAYADLEQHERSFRHLLAGNALKRRDIAYDEQAILGFFDRVRAVFTQAQMQSLQGQGDPSAVPVFIVGMPRSGTTLVEQILASHPAVFGAGELQDFMHVVDSLNAPNDASLCFPEVVSSLSGDTLRQLGARYLAGITPQAPDAARITDKMPGNFAYVGLLHLTLPNARIIHMRRDPIDTCLSCFSVLFAAGQPQCYDLAELGRYYRAYATLMDHWRHVLPTRAMLDVQYEDLVADMEQQARRIIAFCGLEWDDACMAFHATQRAVRTSSAAQVRQPIYRTSVGRWRPYGDLLLPLIEALGLAPRVVPAPSVATAGMEENAPR